MSHMSLLPVVTVYTSWIINRVLDFHIEKKSDITVVCKDMTYNANVSRFGVVRMDEDSRITEFDEKPIRLQSNTISTGIYVIEDDSS